MKKKSFFSGIQIVILYSRTSKKFFLAESFLNTLRYWDIQYYITLQAHGLVVIASFFASLPLNVLL